MSADLTMSRASRAVQPVALGDPAWQPDALPRRADPGRRRVLAVQHRPEGGPGFHLPPDGGAGASGRAHRLRRCRIRWSTRSSASCRRRRSLDSSAPIRGPGAAVIFVNIKGEARGREITDAFYQVRKKVGDIRQTLPARRDRPVLQRRVRRHLHHPPCRYRRRLLLSELKTRPSASATCCCAFPVSRRSICSAPRTKKSLSRFPRVSLAERDLSALDISAALAGQNTLDPRAVSRATSARCASMSRAFSARSKRSASCGCASATRPSGSVTSPTVKRGLMDPPVAKTRYQGKEAVMHRRGDGQWRQGHRCRPVDRRRVEAGQG